MVQTHNIDCEVSAKSSVGMSFVSLSGWSEVAHVTKISISPVDWMMELMRGKSDCKAA
jgi:hypothetical protein